MGEESLTSSDGIPLADTREATQEDVVVWGTRRHEELYCIVLYCIACIVLYWIVLYSWGGHCCPMHCDLFEIYCAPPNLDITRTRICSLNFAQRPIFFKLEVL